MYAKRIKYKNQKWDAVFQPHTFSSKCSRRELLQSRCYSRSAPYRDHTSPESSVKDFRIGPFILPRCGWRHCATEFLGGCNKRWTYSAHRLYSSEGDGRNASEGKQVPVKDSANVDKSKTKKEKIRVNVNHSDEHARLGEQDHQDWLANERLSFESRKKESPFLTKKERFKNEFLRRVVPWEKITVSWDTFPYYINEQTKSTLIECVAANLKKRQFATAYGAGLSSSSGRILIQSIPGTELYLERLVRALAQDLQVPLLLLDSSVLSPHDFGEECESESETDEENEESGEECTSDSEVEDANDASNEGGATSSEVKSDSSDEEEIDVKASVEVLKKHLVPYTIEDLEKKLAQEAGLSSLSDKSETADSSQQSKQPFKRGDRVKYVGATLHSKANDRISLGKIATTDGPTSAYTFISKRPLLNGQRGEVYELNGAKVAVVFESDILEGKDSKDEMANGEETAKTSVYWIDVEDIEIDSESQAEDWYIAVEALFEVLPSVQPLIIYFPDSSRWLSRAVPKSKRKEFVDKFEQMLQQLSDSVVFICGQNKVETGPKEREKLTMVFPNLGRIGQLPIPLKQLTKSLKAGTPSKDSGINKIFHNFLWIQPPKEDELLRTFNKQMEEDKKFVIARNNLCELYKVLEEHNLSCVELMHLSTEGVILSKQKAEKVVSWARNHYLATCAIPCVKGERLLLPRESMEVALSRIRELEMTSRKPSQSLKSLAKDDYESNFVSAVVPPEEVGVKFDDIGALEEVKQTLNELVILPMRRPELFSRGNLLRPCKGILLFGPPGTGKTLLAKALATEAGANFISITGSTLTSKWFGDAEKLTKALFSFASKLAPVIIFVDEVDSLLGARGGAFEHEATRRMRNEFMAAWDGLRTKDSQRILILGATNRPFDLDDAVIRRLPRRKILKIFLAQENLDKNFRYDALANATEGYSGSDLKNLCIAAAYRPVQELLEEEKKVGGIDSPVLRPLKLDDFIAAKAKVGASVAYDAFSMNQLRKWNEQYGEGGSRKRVPFGI
ncbi:hypothetical protein H6P81_011176 [Aristolochia fimbriata]|uniref:AAA+ ATPase domain-containing protein n=1 Tax=Aristolochia fimbriata TaxID=158543 RepID=A0AAV7ETP1_ARIFI|nr:hypothetical protein H6P81_011176 [Aristolochia fimbriata]